MMSSAAVMLIPVHRSLLVRAVERARRLPIVAHKADTVGLAHDVLLRSKRKNQIGFPRIR
jgi:hypothetical protein